MERFNRIAHGAAYIVYSTHSHYMLNSLWLEKAYIIENKATDYDKEEDIDAFSIRKTDIKAIKYKTFVGSYPTKTTYFQPVLDALQVAFSPLIRASKAIIIEGKNDFHAFKYLVGQMPESQNFYVYPGNGAGHSGCLINLFRGWGVDFRIILDDDKAGRQAKAKYVTEYFVLEQHVVTLADISDQFKGDEFEAIYKDDVRSAVKNMFEVNSIQKKRFSVYFQDLLASNSCVAHPLTEKAFEPIRAWVETQFVVSK